MMWRSRIKMVAAAVLAGGVLTATAPVAQAGPLPVQTVDALAGPALTDKVYYGRRGYYGRGFGHRGYYGGGFGAGAALGFIGAATFGGYGPYYGGYGYAPVYGYGYGYRPRFYRPRPVFYGRAYYPRRFYGYGRPYGFRRAYYGRPYFGGHRRGHWY